MNKETTILQEVTSDDLFQLFQERFDAVYDDNEATVAQLTETLEQIKKEDYISENKNAKDLISEYGEVISTTVINSFGLGPFFHQDQTGGKVTTIHNAQQNIFANDHTKFDRSKYKYSTAAKQLKQENYNKNGYYKDGYTGKKTDKPVADHIVPLKSFHKNGGFMLTDEAKSAFASDKRNLIVIDSTVNGSKSDQNLQEFVHHKTKSSDDPNKARFGLDERRTRAAANRGNAAHDDHKPTTSQKAKYYVKEGGIAAANEGFQLGMRQAIGMFMYTLSNEIFIELRAESKNLKQYFKENRLVEELKNIVTRVFTKVRMQLKNIVAAFGEGFVGGLFTSILTTIINCFKTTSKRFIKIMREGILSIVRAIRILIFPPKDMPKQQVLREAIKLLISGLFVAGGLVLEEIFEKKLVALGVPGSIANLISTTIIGILTGISIVTVMYLLDNLLKQLPSTTDLIQKSKELMHTSDRLELAYNNSIQNIHHSTNDSFLERIQQTDNNVDDLIDFFEE